MIDYKDGKIVWDNSSNWSLDGSKYAFDQDILQVSYPVPQGMLVIDVGSYMGYGSDSVENHNFTIHVVLLEDGKLETEQYNPWTDPVSTITCIDKQDMLLQLQRAIDTYPKMMRRVLLT